MESKTRIPFTVKVYPEIKAKLERIAELDGRTLSNLAELILVRYCDASPIPAAREVRARSSVVKQFSK